MKAIVKTKREKDLELQDLPMPEPRDEEVLIKVKAAAICGSDLKLYNWEPGCEKVFTTLPVIPGHECSGEVVSMGEKVQNISIGDKVAAETHVPCGTCWQCLHGRPHTCENMGLFGHNIDGCFAEYVVIPSAAVRKVPSKLSFTQAALLEPMGVSLRPVLEGNVMGDSVVIIGAGPIGLFAVAFAKIMGAGQVIVLDVNAKRLEYATEVGADDVIKPEGDDIIQKIDSLTKDFGGVGVVIEASGNVNAIHQAIQYTRVGGKLFLIGQTNLPVSFHPSRDIVKKELTMRGFYGRQIWDTWEKTEEILLSGQLDVTPIISHRFSLDQFEEAFQIALSGFGAKILLLPE